MANFVIVTPFDRLAIVIWGFSRGHPGGFRFGQVLIFWQAIITVYIESTRTLTDFQVQTLYYG